ncbi:MAG: hypothetical protein JWM31_686 [Solirubrobacterales bacterium]|nr:hypothetical protein [Solirubrobacterales bacterium]
MEPATHPQPPEHTSGNGHEGKAKDDKAKDVIVKVNNRPVSLPDRSVTGLQIKQAAIAAGLLIDAGFVLLLDEADGRDRVVGDDEVVKVNKNSTFSAIAPDDNS